MGLHNRLRSAGPAAWCLAAAALFGASTPAAKILLSDTGPLLLSGLLYLGAAIAVGPTAIGRWRRHKRTDHANRSRLAGAVVLGGMVGPVLLLWGLSLATAGSVSLWLTMETVATALFARLIFREHLGRRGWAAVGLILVASVALAGQEPAGPLAALLVAGACVAWGLDNSLTAIIDGYTTAQITFVKGLTTGAVAIPIGAGLAGNPTPPQIIAALCIGALGYGLSLVLYVAAAQQLGATRSQLWFSTAPIFGLLVAWIFLSEAITLEHAGAATLMAIALWILSRQHHAHPHRHEPRQHTHWHRHTDDHHDHDHPQPTPPASWHQHPHPHTSVEHTHPHPPDIHHRHRH